MKLIIGERIIESEIQRRAEARKTYEQARKSGRKASLVEQQRPNLFTNNVANIGPGESVTVEIAYQQSVTYRNERFSIRFPLTAGVRYIPGAPRIDGFDGGGWALNTDQVADASRITPPMTATGAGHPNPVRIEVHLDAGMALSQVTSSYHPIKWMETQPHHYRVSLANERVPADRDFELTWMPEPGKAPRAALFVQAREDADYALLMLLPPEIGWARQNALSREMIFVIDTSGSMAGASIEQAKEALQLGLERLKPGDRFNIIEFNSQTRNFAPAAVDVTAESLSQARRFVEGLVADGGTEMAGALEAALKNQQENGRLRQVVFLTDGSIGNEEQLFRIINDRLGRSRLYTIGIGSAPNSHFMREAATLGKGTFTYIGDAREVRNKMDHLFEKLEFPVLSDIEIHWSSGAETDYWPRPVPDLYLHEPLIVSFKLDRSESELQLSGRMNGKTWRTTLPVGKGGEARGLDVLWARNKIRSLEQQRSRGVPPEQIKQAITELGLKHHIVTAHTSLVAVDKTPSRPADKASRDAAVPNKMPQGWTMARPTGRLPQTATATQLHLLLGMLLLLLGLGIALLEGKVATGKETG
jgi:Ca-activated chloride channel family protein